MLTARPRILDSHLDSDLAGTDASQIPQSGVSRTAPAEAPIDHHCQICPTCGNRLTGHRCKLICTQCGYYLSCADYF